MQQVACIKWTIGKLPPELLIQILSNLSAPDLIKCRQVCVRWRDAVDFLSTKDYLWLEYFQEDYGNKYNLSQLNTRSGLSYFNIYKSISLWSKLDDSLEYIDEFAAATKVTDEIINLKVLKNGTIGVHKHDAIIYYDLITWYPSNQPHIIGTFLKYSENDVLLVTLNFQLLLCIRNKRLQCNVNQIKENCITSSYENVKTFLLIKNQVYYVSLTDVVFVWELETTNNFTNHAIQHFDEGIMFLGFKEDRLNMITFPHMVWSLNIWSFRFVYALNLNSNLLHVFWEYNFLENIDWRIYFQWMYVLNRHIPEGPLQDLVTVRAYGDVVFVGTNWGVLRIYYAPYISGEFDFTEAEPIKQYNFMEPHGFSMLSICPIIQIDVLEIEQGHIVLVAMPKKIAVINYSHN